MSPRTKPLPQHDALSWLTRAIEVTCIAVALALLTWHGVRFMRMTGDGAWWLWLVAAAGMLSADFASGFVHWTADTWGKETMPILGRRFLRPFRVHHVNPDDFLLRDVIDTNGDVAGLVIPFLAAAFLIPLDAPWGRAAAVWLVAFCLCGLPTNQVHQWAHMGQPPRWVDWLQRRGILLNRAAHARHHTAPYVANYCITTGWCNAALTSLGVFRRLEQIVTRATGLPARGDDGAFADSVFAGADHDEVRERARRAVDEQHRAQLSLRCDHAPPDSVARPS